MKALLLISAGIVAAGAVAAPAFAGLNDNPSFSHQIPIRVPSQAQVLQTVDDHGSDSRPAPATSPTAVRTPSRHAEPGDDRASGSRAPEPGDDHGSDSTQAEPGDDHGSDSTQAEPSDDHGSDSTQAEPSDDHGGHGGSGGDDSSSHG